MPDINREQFEKAAALCAVDLEAIGDFQLRKALKPQLDLKKIFKKRVSNPLKFRAASIVTTFVHSVGGRTQGIWKFLKTASQTDAGVRLVELEQPSLKKNVKPLCREDPYLHSLHSLQISKGAVLTKCQRIFQGWSINH